MYVRMSVYVTMYMPFNRHFFSQYCMQRSHDTADLISRTYAQTQRISRAYYGCAPKLEFLSKPTHRFPYIPVRTCSPRSPH